jgi:hypothetical protein
MSWIVVSRRRLSITSSSRSIPPSRPAWGSACQSAVESSKRMADDCGGAPTCPVARSFSSQCPLIRTHSVQADMGLQLGLTRPTEPQHQLDRFLLSLARHSGHQSGTEMLRKALATTAAAAIMVTAFVVPSADPAKSKKGKRGRQETITVAPSFDGRTTGRTRTCGHDTMLYDSNSMPYGPYCH